MTTAGTAAAKSAALVERVALRLGPDPSRVVAQLFVAGEEVTSGPSRMSTVMRRVASLTEAEVTAELAEVMARFAGRHDDLTGTLLSHYHQVSERSDTGPQPSASRKLLFGAYATSEYAIESAALCNPSIVAHPDQSGVEAGWVRFVLSLRAIGEGHISSIEFRVGLLGPEGQIEVADPGARTALGTVTTGPYDRDRFTSLLGRTVGDGEVANAILRTLGRSFDRTEFDAALGAVRSRVLDRQSGRAAVARLCAVADSNYSVTFPEGSALSQRVLRPQGPTERGGIEDARWVRFTDDDGTVTYYGTYTAFDGASVAPKLLATSDFRTFTASQLTGRAAANKGMAVFPRRVGGRFIALSRWDRESNAVTTSPDGYAWDAGTDIHVPGRPWELVQVGNCGSPIETDEGWLVITHAVGPMRTYSLGALLLDLDDPTVVRASLSEPMLEPEGHERDGYVPNVVYSCGALLHGSRLVLPYAYGDRATTFATIDLPTLLARLLDR